MDLTEAAQRADVSGAGHGHRLQRRGSTHPERASRARSGLYPSPHGDTEVLLRPTTPGAGLRAAAHGMFAFAIWERDSGKVVFGVTFRHQALLLQRVKARCASPRSLPALLKAGGVDTEIDPVALNSYLSFHAVVPAPTPAGVRKLAPGTLMVVHSGRPPRREDFLGHAGGVMAEDEARSWTEWCGVAARTGCGRRSSAAWWPMPVGAALRRVDSSLIVGLMAEAGVRDLRYLQRRLCGRGWREGQRVRVRPDHADEFGTEPRAHFRARGAAA